MRKVLVLSLIAVNVLVFAANLYVSNHCWNVVDFHMLVVLFRDGNLDLLWMPGGFLTFSELIFDGPMVDLGQVLFGLDTKSIFEGHHLYSLFTYAFLHADIFHLVSNMIALLFYSSMVFNAFGKKEFSIWYVSGIFGGAIATLIKAAITGKTICVVGASAAIFGLLGGLLSPMLFMVIKVKSTGGNIGAANRRGIFEYVFFILMIIIPGFFEENVSWEGHLGGLIGGLLVGLVMMWVKHGGRELVEQKVMEKIGLVDNEAAHAKKERIKEIDAATLEKRRRIGTIVLISGMVISIIVVIGNLLAGLSDYGTLSNAGIYAAWNANLIWCVLGWIPNVVAHRLLRGCGKKHKVMLTIAWILWLFVGPTGIFNPIPQSV